MFLRRDLPNEVQMADVVVQRVDDGLARCDDFARVVVEVRIESSACCGVMASPQGRRRADRRLECCPGGFPNAHRTSGCLRVELVHEQVVGDPSSRRIRRHRSTMYSVEAFRLRNQRRNERLLA